MTEMINKCFKARMNLFCGGFPLKTFREQFVKEYAEHGLVLIQGKACDLDGFMAVDHKYGFMFSEQRFVDIAIKFCQKWGFKVERKEHRNKLGEDMPAYSVTIPEEYLRNRMSRYEIGWMRTRDRSIAYANTPEAKENRKNNKSLWI